MTLTRAVQMIAVMLGALGASASYGMNDLGRALSATGITANAFAAAGVGSAQAGALLQSMSSAPELQLLSQARRLLDAAQQTLDDVSGQASAGDEAAVQAVARARNQLEVAKGAFEAACSAFRETMLSGLGPEAQARLRAWWSNGADLPAECRVVAWTAEEVAALRAALLHERVAAGGGEPLGQADLAFLQQVRTRAAVADARAHLATDSSGIAAVIRQATR